jgi:hypothetical protein
MKPGANEECRVGRAGKNMKRKITVFALIAMLFALCLSAEAQQTKKIPHIGYLTSSGRASFEAFAAALRQLGYVEGKSVIF